LALFVCTTSAFLSGGRIVLTPAPVGHRPLTHLEKVRREKRLTQKQLGEHPQVRIAQDFISRIERGEGLPTPGQAARIAKVLGIAPDLLTVPVKNANSLNTTDEP
jgi:predicted transcriptional regulator